MGFDDLGDATSLLQADPSGNSLESYAFIHDADQGLTSKNRNLDIAEGS